VAAAAAEVVAVVAVDTGATTEGVAAVGVVVDTGVITVAGMAAPVAVAVARGEEATAVGTELSRFQSPVH
jgi:hypothetical protein